MANIHSATRWCCHQMLPPDALQLDSLFKQSIANRSQYKLPIMIMHHFASEDNLFINHCKNSLSMTAPCSDLLFLLHSFPTALWLFPCSGSAMSRSQSAGRDRPASYSYGYQDSTSSLDSSGTTRSTHSASRNNNMIAEVRWFTAQCNRWHTGSS